MSSEGQILSKPCWGLVHDPAQPRRVVYEVPLTGVHAWASGQPLEVAFPDLSDEDYERIRSGYCPACQRWAQDRGLCPGPWRARLDLNTEGPPAPDLRSAQCHEDSDGEPRPTRTP
ncbi:MAG: hypothetical protein VM34scaffold347_54 [Phage 66_12]|jgi:hypothetical protein|nr:MAG: hypothetical protein VM34scaffold347_54 [Phage 66_12]